MELYEVNKIMDNVFIMKIFEEKVKSILIFKLIIDIIKLGLLNVLLDINKYLFNICIYLYIYVSQSVLINKIFIHKFYNVGNFIFTYFNKCDKLDFFLQITVIMIV